ncbi:MAG: hypothetical protein H6Q53_738 [Deltaproteobacteria bacterium]|nr:hypothetical protein [Deltaproteobacteria bacterium]
MNVLLFFRPNEWGTELTSPISGSKGRSSPAWRDGRGDVSPRKLGLQEFKKKSKIA